MTDDKITNTIDKISALTSFLQDNEDKQVKIPKVFVDSLYDTLAIINDLRAGKPTHCKNVCTEPPKVTKHREICNQLNATYKAKNEAYGDSFGKTFNELGIISAITRMTDKLNRVTSLALGAENNVKDETMSDTLLDLANYAIMTEIELEEQNK